MCVSAADRQRDRSPPREISAAVPARGDGQGARVTRAGRPPAPPCHPGRCRSGEQGHLQAARSANIPLSFPFPVRRSRRTELGLCFFSPSFKKKKKNAPVQSFLRLPARGSEDNITYVIYMHIKSFAGGCVCREILCEGSRRRSLGRASWEAPRRDSQKTRSSWWKSVRAHGRPAALPSSFRGRLGAGTGGRNPGERGGGRERLALLGQNGLRCSLRTCP